MAVRVKLINWYGSEDVDDLVLAALKSLVDVEIVTEIADASLVICSFHGIQKVLKRTFPGITRIPVLNKLIRPATENVILRPDQTSLFVSIESPAWTGFLGSGCDFGISHQFLPSIENHIRVPYWKYSIDWSMHGVFNNCKVRSGLTIKPDFLTETRQLLDHEYSDHLAMISSHLNGFKKFFFNDLSSKFKIDLAGGPNGKVDSKAQFLAVNNYLYSLCPENTICPGYYTEKTLEAWALGTIPVTCHDSLAELDFNQEGYINLYKNIPQGLASSLYEITSDKTLVKQIYSKPLFSRSPSIHELLNFLDKVLSTVHKMAPI